MNLNIPKYEIPAFIVCSIFVALFTGCTTSYVVSTKPDSLSCSYEFANSRLNNRDATIEFVDGQTIEATNVSFSADSIRFDFSRGTRHAQFDLALVKQINSRDHGKGTTQGLEVGALSGATTGLAILFAARRNEPSVWDAPTLGYAVLGGGGALLGGAFGALAGNSLGHSDLFTIETTHHPSQAAEPPIPLDTTFSGRYVVSLGIASAFSGSDFEGGWRTSYALHLGLGKVITKSITAFANFDYYKFHPAPYGGNSVLSPQSARRQDFALYGSVLLARVIVLGAGLYYTTSDQVYGASMFDNFFPYPSQGSGFSEVRSFSIVGLSYDIRFGDTVFVPVGLFYRTSYNINDFIPIYGRLGVGVTF